jgi:hypothetical protein
MGKLSEVVLATTSIRVSENSSFEVRGVNLYDILRLMANYAPECMLLYKEFFEKLGARQAADPTFVANNSFLADIAIDALKRFPQFVFALIAFASDDDTPAARAAAAKLPLGAQLEAIQAIVILSISTESELKKLMEIVVQVVTGVRVAIEVGKSPASDLGFGNFGSE